MTEQLDTEDWKAFRKESQEHKAGVRNTNTVKLYKFITDNGIDCEVKTEYQFRLTKPGFPPIDVFPTSNKVHVLKKGSNKYQKTNIIEFLHRHFKIN